VGQPACVLAIRTSLPESCQRCTQCAVMFIGSSLVPWHTVMWPTTYMLLSALDKHTQWPVWLTLSAWLTTGHYIFRYNQSLKPWFKTEIKPKHKATLKYKTKFKTRLTSKTKDCNQSSGFKPNGPFQLPAPQSGTLSQISSRTRPSVQTVLDVCLKCICLLDTSPFSAFRVLDDNRAI